MSGIHPVAPAPPPTRADRAEPTRAPVNYGAAVTHRDLVQEKMRVDPAALADRARLAERQTGGTTRDKRLAEDKAEYQRSLLDRRGRSVDVKA
ncbi:hypothetical protein U91I_02558 [alpha proteobacterium U9-1i]|nr:hypothetical protein U91I_02558 [alpha proteobacterium U9-1i]